MDTNLHTLPSYFNLLFLIPPSSSVFFRLPPSSSVFLLLPPSSSFFLLLSPCSSASGVQYGDAMGGGGGSNAPNPLDAHDDEALSAPVLVPRPVAGIPGREAVLEVRRR